MNWVTQPPFSGALAHQLGCPGHCLGLLVINSILAIIWGTRVIIQGPQVIV